MNARYWIFIAGLSGALAVAAGAIGAHVLPGSYGSLEIFHTGQLYHVLHTLALFGTGLFMLVSEGKRADYSSVALQVAAAGFTIGMLCFSGGLYVQVARALTTTWGIVPFGGMALITGWLALAISALGLRRY
jgi:uncharacterized membrane protein YgdD (TMEM256/DUF423 family)